MSLHLAPLDEEDDVLTVTPVQPEIGAEVGGIDLARPLSDAGRDAIKRALIRHKVLFFRDQSLDAEQQAGFARRFGRLYEHPTTQAAAAHPAIHKIAAVDFKDPGTPREDARRWDAYHTDTSWRLVPTWGAVLRAVTLPPCGGDTIWVSGSLAYDSLDERLKQRLADLHVTHDFRPALKRSGHDYPIVAHPVVRVHPQTGERILWVNFSQDPSIVGVDRAEAEALLVEILDRYRRPENQVRFSWRPGSIAFWDNRATVHYAVRNYGDFPRTMDRVLIADEPLHADL